MTDELTPHQLSIMQMIADIPDVTTDTLLHISHRKYPKYNERRDYEYSYTPPVWIKRLKTSANALKRKGYLVDDRSWCYKLTRDGMEYIKGLKS